VKSKIKSLAIVVAMMLAGCTANGGFGDDGGGNGGGDGGGGDSCLLRDPVTGICIIGGPDTGLPNFTCTQVPAAGSTLTVSETGPLCTLTDPLNAALNTCDVENPNLTLDRDYDSAATVQYVVGALDPALGGVVSLAIGLPSTVPAGQVAAFVVDYPGGMVLDASLLRALNVVTTLDGVEQETTFFETLLDLDVLGLIGGSGKIVVGYPNTLPYNGLTLRVDATLLTGDITNAVNVYEACLNGAPTP